MRQFLARVRIPLLLSSVGVCFVLLALLWAWVAFHRIGGTVVISFTNEMGILRVGTPGVLYGTAFVALVALAINSFLVAALLKRDNFLAGFLGVATLFLGFLIFVGFAAIISVN